MKTEINEKFEAYFSEVKEGLALLPELQQKVLSDLKESVRDYLEDHPEATVEEIHDHFGSPETVISDNTLKVPVTEVVKSKRVKKWVIVGIVAVVLIITVVMLGIYMDNWKSAHGQTVIMPPEEVTGSDMVTPPSSAV